MPTFRKVVLLAAFLLALPLSAQITGTVTDTDGQVWANGTFSAQLVSPRGGPTVNGVPQSTTPVTGTMNASGVFTFTAPVLTNALDQTGAYYEIRVRPNSSANDPVRVQAAITSSTQDLSAQFSAVAPPRFTAGPGAYGYGDQEVRGGAPLGSTYYNVLLSASRQLLATGWVTVGGGGGGGGAVASVFGRTGAVTAQAGDYTAAKISGLAPSATTDTTNANNITSGTLPVAQTAALTGDVTKAAGATAVTVTKTNGVAFAPSATTDTTNGSNITSGTIPVSVLPVATASVAGVQTTAAVTQAQSTANQALAAGRLKPAVAVYCYGTSYIYGTGATTPLTTGICGLVGRDSPGTINNFGQAGSTISQISGQLFGTFAPTSLGPSVSLLDGGENNSALTTAADNAALKNTEMASIAWLTIPTSYRILASAATASGTWITGTTLPTPPNLTSPGSGLQSNTVNSSLTFNVPSTNTGNKIGITYLAPASGTGTFTVAIDGTLQTDNCSNSTTFTAVTCSTVVGGTQNRQEYTVSANTAHTVVVTITGGGSYSPILSVDWLPPATVSGVLGAPSENVAFVNTITNYFGAAASYNAVISSVISTLQAEGLPVYLVDLNNGLGSARGLNATTDLSTTATTTCPASTTGGHPNDCGYNVWLSILNAVEAQNNYIFSSIGLGGKLTQYTGYVQTLLNANPACTSFDSCMNRIGQTTVGTGFYGYNSTNKIGYRTNQFSASGKPYNGAFGQEFYDTLGGWFAVAAYAGSSVTSGAATTPHWAVKTTTGESYADGPASVPQVIAIGGTPTIAAGAAAGTSPTVAIAVGSTNMAGVITTTSGTSTTANGTYATITFNGTLGTAPQGCQVTARNSGAAANVTAFFTTAPSTTTWTLATGSTAPAASTAMSWAYLCE